MIYVTTTDLRKSSAKLRDSLQKGESVYIMHRSKVIGVVAPYAEKPYEKPKVFTLAKYKKFLKAFPPPQKNNTHMKNEKRFMRII